MNVHVADDQEVLIGGYLSNFNLSNINLVGFSLNGYDLIQWIKNNTCDVLVLDINMPEIDGIEVLRYFKKNNIKVKTIVFTEHEQEMFIQETLSLGVKGYVLKRDKGENLVKSIYKVYNGGFYFSETIAEVIQVNNLDVDYLSIIKNDITPRELEVLDLLQQEYTNDEIGGELDMSSSSVRNLTMRLRKKFMVNTNVGLVKRAYLYLKK